MKVWLIQDGEPLPGIDPGARDWRCGMLAKALVAGGHQVLWWASTFDHALKCHRFKAARTIELQPRIRIRLLHGPGYTHSKSPKRYYHHRVLAAAFQREAQASPLPDILYCSVPTLELAEKSVLFGQEMKLPVVVDLRDAWPDHYLSLVPTPLRGLARLLLFSEFQRARKVFGGATGIVAISEAYLDLGLRYAGRDRCAEDGLFSMGYPEVASDTEMTLASRPEELASRYSLEKNQLVVTFVGSFTTSFALPTVIHAARQLANAGRADIRFMIIGEGDQGKTLRAMAAGLSNIVFTGWLDQPSVQAMLRISSVGLAPYRNDTMISLPNKPFEYMAAELPLLSCLPGELETIISKNKIGFQYRAEDVDSLLQRILWFADHPEERKAMGKRSLSLFNECFRADVIYPRLVRHLESIAGGTPNCRIAKQGITTACGA